MTTTTTTMTITKPTPTLTATKGERAAAPSIDHLDRHGYLFGKHLKKSMSPLLHDVVYKNIGLNWAQVRLDSTDMSLFLRLIQHPKFYGASVTMPHKVAILSHLDELTPECRAVGACNTLYVRPDPARPGRRLYCGTNTDTVGVRDSFLRNLAPPALEASIRGRPALVVGGGGAARSAVYALRRWLGATVVYLVNRDKAEVDALVAWCRASGYGEGDGHENGEGEGAGAGGLVHVETVAQARGLEGPGAVVACVPDLEPATEAERRARAVTEVFLREKEHKGAMLEMCYNPSPYTRLGALAEEAGWRVILGTEALIWQGIEQDKYWTGRTAEELPVKEVKEEIARQLATRPRV